MRLFFTLLLLGLSALVQATESTPWGAGNIVEVQYQPHKVVYDVAVSDARSFELVLDRVSRLSSVYHADPFDASIVLVLHGDEISFFDTRQFAKHKDLMQRAQSLTVGNPIEFRLCRLAASARGIQPEHIHGFVKIVPMADAEIVRLQHEEDYAYMR